MRSPEEMAREALGNIAGPMRHIFGSSPAHHELLDALDVLVSQEIGNTEQLIRARDAEVRAEVDRIALTLSTMTTQGGADAKRIAEAAAALVGLEWETRTLWISPLPGVRERRLVGPWEPIEP